MQDKKKHILCTRPLDEMLIKEADEKGFAVEVSSFIETKQVEDIAVKQEIEKVAAQPNVVVFTSMNAVEAVASVLAGQRPDWRIFCMGNTTKKLVCQYFGDNSIAGSATDAAELAVAIVDDRFIDDVFFFCGDIRRDELPAVLKKNNIGVKEMVVYTTLLLQHQIEKNYDGILFFSPSAVQSFFSSNKLPLSTTLFAIGKTTADEIKKYSTNNIIIGDEPGKENLVQKMIEYFKNTVDV